MRAPAHWRLGPEMQLMLEIGLEIMGDGNGREIWKAATRSLLAQIKEGKCDQSLNGSAETTTSDRLCASACAGSSTTNSAA